MKKDVKVWVGNIELSGKYGEAFITFFLLALNSFPLSLVGLGVEKDNVFYKLIGVFLGLVIIKTTLRLVNTLHNRFKIGEEGLTVDRSTNKSVLSYLVKYLLLSAIVTVVLSVLNIENGGQSNQEELLTLIGQSKVIMIFMVTIYAPIIEEVIYREIMPSVLGGTVISYIMSSIIFILMHRPSGVYGIMAYAVPSIIYTYARIKEDDLWIPIILHMMTNAIALISIMA